MLMKFHMNPTSKHVLAAALGALLALSSAVEGQQTARAIDQTSSPSSQTSPKNSVNTDELRSIGQNVAGGARDNIRQGVQDYNDAKNGNGVAAQPAAQFPTVREQVLNEDIRGVSCSNAQANFQQKQGRNGASCTSYLALVAHTACYRQLLDQGMPQGDFDRLFAEYERVVEQMSGDSRQFKWSNLCN